MNYERKVIDVLDLLGASRLYSGYNYIVYGLMLLLEDNKFMLDVIKPLYIDIAKHYNTSWNCVEKNIRYIVKSIWISENNDLLIQIFKRTALDQRPVNKEFFRRMYEYINRLDNHINLRSDCFIVCPISHTYCKSFTEYCLNAIDGKYEIKV